MERAATGLSGRTAVITAVAMIAFAANSIFCRLALAHGAIDPATFTYLRLASGAAVLFLLHRHAKATRIAGSWRTAAALLVYAACFSFAYVNLAAGTGALLLFGAVQATMVLRGLLAGERLGVMPWVGLILAFCGLVMLVAPGVGTPDPVAALLMTAAGVAWGLYSLLGSEGCDPVAASCGNFLRAALLGIPLLFSTDAQWSGEGVAWALLSGGIASGLGYVAWYSALRGLTATKAASVQLSVPVLTALGGVLLLGEAFTVRHAVTSLAILGGIFLVVRNNDIHLGAGVARGDTEPPRRQP